jgi:uncharacterized membrane protein
MGNRGAVLLVALAAAAWLAGAVAAPMVEAAGSDAGSLLHFLYSPVCHQSAERSLPLAGGHLAICARCAGLYLGGVLGLIAGAMMHAGRRRNLRWPFFAAMIPMAMDVLAPFVGLPGLSNVPRFLVSIPTGAVCGWYLASAVRELAGSWLRGRWT